MLSRCAGNPDRRVISACVIPDVTGAGGSLDTWPERGVREWAGWSSRPDQDGAPRATARFAGVAAYTDIAFRVSRLGRRRRHRDLAALDDLRVRGRAKHRCAGGPADLADPAAVVSPALVPGHERHPDLLRDRARRSRCRLRPGRGAARCPAEPPVAGGGRDRRDHRAGPAAARRVYGQPQLRGVRPDRPDRPQPVRDDAGAVARDRRPDRPADDAQLADRPLALRPRRDRGGLGGGEGGRHHDRLRRGMAEAAVRARVRRDRAGAGPPVPPRSSGPGQGAPAVDREPADARAVRRRRSHRRARRRPGDPWAARCAHAHNGSPRQDPACPGPARRAAGRCGHRRQGAVLSARASARLVVPELDQGGDRRRRWRRGGPSAPATWSPGRRRSRTCWCAAATW